MKGIGSTRYASIGMLLNRWKFHKPHQLLESACRTCKTNTLMFLKINLEHSNQLRQNYPSKKIAKLISAKLVLCLETYGWRRTEKTLEWRYSHERWVEWLGNAHCTCPKERWIFQDLWWLQRRSKPRTTSWAVSLAPPVKISLQSLPGQTFSKIDLRQAYHKLEMEEDSKKYLTINTHMGLF